LQEFASNICQQNSMTYSDFDQNLTAINADGIYLATYSSLLLSLQLMRAGHYKNQDVNFFFLLYILILLKNFFQGSILIPLSEQQFVMSVQNCGVLVYLSSAWLRELYQNVLVTNALQSLQNSYDNSLNTHCALVDLLCDSSGIGATQFLSEWERLQSVAKIHKDISDHQFAAKKIARRLLTCSWESIVTVLSAGLGDSEAVVNSKLANLSKKTMRNNKQKNKKHGEALFALSLEGLHAVRDIPAVDEENCLNLFFSSGRYTKQHSEFTAFGG
jgi:brefeldin A-inhibited guanine nucleotide-exchange protein 3